MIVRNYPVDPYTKDSFSIRERITVKDYASKVTDIFKLYQFRTCFEKCVKDFQKKIIKDTMEAGSNGGNQNKC